MSTIPIGRCGLIVHRTRRYQSTLLRNPSGLHRYALHNPSDLLTLVSRPSSDCSDIRLFFCTLNGSAPSFDCIGAPLGTTFIYMTPAHTAQIVLLSASTIRKTSLSPFVPQQLNSMTPADCPDRAAISVALTFVTTLRQ